MSMHAYSRGPLTIVGALNRMPGWQRAKNHEGKWGVTDGDGHWLWPEEYTYEGETHLNLEAFGGGGDHYASFSEWCGALDLASESDPDYDP